jgi:hypothetical protein
MLAADKENVPPVNYAALLKKVLAQPRSHQKHADNRTREQRRESAALAQFKKKVSL